MTIPTFAPGGYRFIPAVFQYSGGVAAEPGFQIERAVFHEPVPLALGFRACRGDHQGARAAADGVLRLRAALAPAVLRRGLPRVQRASTCDTLARWGIYDGTTNPVARSNVCPEMAPPAEPSLHAFSLHRAVGPARADLRRRRQRRGAGRAAPPTASAPSATARRARRRCGKRPCSCWARWSGGSGCWASPGAAPRPPRSTRCTTSIRSLPTRSSAAAPRVAG